MAEIDMKEKLVELKKVLRECLHFNYDEFSCDMSLDVDLTAENLIAHGVTVQEWISVKDRLPENDYGKHWKERQYYLVYLGSGTMRVAKYGYKEYDWWITCDDRVLTEKCQAGVTHWMPLPEPPKGE